MVTITREVILSKKGLEGIMSVDLNDSKNYVAKEETFLVEARVVYALLDMEMTPNIYINVEKNISNDLIKNRKDRDSKFAVMEIHDDVRSKNKLVVKVCEVLPKFVYLKPTVIDDLGFHLIKSTDVLSIVSTPAEFKRMLLIFDELKYKRNTHHILDFEIPNHSIRKIRRGEGNDYKGMMPHEVLPLNVFDE